jgi:hypothetical protein
MTNLTQNKRIHGLRKQLMAAGFDDGDYRALLIAKFPLAFKVIPSSKDLSFEQAAKLIDALKALAGDGGDGARRPSETVTGKWGGLLRALWIAGHNLGLIDNPDDRALLDFVEKQTGMSHTRFLNDEADAYKAIEALKAWLTRGGVKWPTAKEAKAGRRTLNWMRKKAVLDAIGVRMREHIPGFDVDQFARACTVPKGYLVTSYEYLGEEMIDHAARLGGEMLRARMAEAKKREAA